MKPIKYLAIFCLAMSLSACNGGGGGDDGGDGGNGGGGETPTPPPNSGQVVGYVNRVLPQPMYTSFSVNNRQDMAVVVRDQTTLNALFDQVPTLFDGLPAELRAPDFTKSNLIVIGAWGEVTANSQPGFHTPSLDDPVVLTGEGLWVGVEKCNMPPMIIIEGVPKAYHVSVYEAPLLPANVTFNWTSRAGTLACNSGDIDSVRIVQ